MKGTSGNAGNRIGDDTGQRKRRRDEAAAARMKVDVCRLKEISG